jgi:murein DD-endopeptidase MepM/ murein hydrolase activator NlpD
VAAGTRRIDLIHRQRELQYQAAVARERLRRLKPKQRAAGYELQTANNRLRRVRNELARTSAQLDSTRDELHDVTLDLQATQTRLGGHREAMSNRLAALYELGGVEYLQVLARAASFADFANRLYLVQLVVDQDLGLLRAMEREQQRVAAYQLRVQAKEREVSLLETRVARKHDEYASARQEKAQAWSSLRRQRIYWERGLAEMEQESRDIGAQIRRYQRTVGRVRWATPWRGSFMRPVYGGVTSGFGYRMHPILQVRKMHTGVDISAGTGTPIHAADAGTVIWSGRRGGYGLCVFIDHGGGMSTVYGHCSRLGCRVGQEVSKGDVVGYVGSTGLSTGPHLHFEVRRNGTPVNPLSF